MTYKIELLPSALKDMKGLPRKLQKRIEEKLDRLADDPFRNSKPLEGFPFRSTRVSDYRIIFQLKKDEVLILVMFVANRKDAYKKVRRISLDKLLVVSTIRWLRLLAQ